MPTKLFVLEPTTLFRVELRRFTYENSRRCPSGAAGHSANTIIHDINSPFADAAFTMEYSGNSADDFPHEDTRWPETCEACGYEFTEEDEWQHSTTRFYRAPTGDLCTLRFGEGLPGGVYEVPWLKGACSEFYRRDWAGKRAPLMVVCPDKHHWFIDGDASNGAGWEVTGDPPNLTARPSILTSNYHGWLTDGVLSDPL